MDDPLEMNICALADRLHRLPHEVRQMPVADYVRLLAYFRIKEREGEK